MEFTKIEVEMIKDAVSKADEMEIQDLPELQLALVGGGIADPAWA
jgi:hypothetical protein